MFDEWREKLALTGWLLMPLGCVSVMGAIVAAFAGLPLWTSPVLGLAILWLAAQV